MKKFFVDRIEDGIVICEDENGDEARFDENEVGRVGEGDVIVENDDGIKHVDPKATEERRKEIIELRKYVYRTKSKDTI